MKPWPELFRLCVRLQSIREGMKLSPELFSFAMQMTVHFSFLFLSIFWSQDYFDFQYTTGFGKVFEGSLPINISFKVFTWGIHKWRWMKSLITF